VDVRSPDTPSILTNVTDMTFTLYDPCNFIIVNAQSMTSDATGKYFYKHTLSSTATYGRYKTRAIATGGSYAVIDNEFFVMPWNAVLDIRTTMGLGTDEKSIDDDAINHITWNSYQYALRDIFTHHYVESPNPDPTNGYMFNGTNTSFKTKYYPLADITGDGNIWGSGDTVSCGSDITCYWVDNNGRHQEGKVKVISPLTGEISIYQYDGTSAIPQDNEGVYLDYWVRSWRYDEYLFQQAVVRLACHEISRRLTTLDKVTLADIRNNNPIIMINPNLFMNEYQRYIKRNREMVLGGV